MGTLKNNPNQWCNNSQYTWTSDQASTLGITFTNTKSKLHELNLNKQIKSFQHCLNNWKKWNLTLIGKITVLKTFAFPKLVYPLTVLENPPSETIAEINNIMYEFLWNGKPDKIARKTITQNYENCGLKMIDIYSFINTLKLSWIKRLKGSQNQWKNAYNKELSKYGGDLVFKCNIHQNEAKNICKKYVFLNEILIAWTNINFKKVENTSRISNEIIWNNSNITNTNGYPIFYKDWYNKGIMFIKNIYNFRTKTFYSFDELKQMFDLNNGDFLKYYSIQGNIKETWKNKLKLEEINYDTPDFLISTVTSMDKPSKMLYKTQIEKNILTSIKPLEKWKNETNTPDINWKTIFCKSFKCTISTKLREFQYKYLMRIIPNNSFLFKCKIKPSNLCDFCNMSIDSNKHLFWECIHTQEFWSEINQLMKNKLNYNTNVNYNTISFCNIQDTPQQKAILVNFIILLAKYFIFKCKCNIILPTINSFNSYLRKTIKIEETIAFMKNKMDIFNLKWNDFITN